MMLQLRKWDKTMIKGQKISENMLYAVLWTILFAAPLLSSYFSGQNDSALQSMDWEGVWHAWQMLGLFFVTFLIHNFFIAPLLVYRNMKGAYMLATGFLGIVFVSVLLFLTPSHPHPGPMEPVLPAEPEMPMQIGQHPVDKLDIPLHPKQMHPEPPRVLGGQQSVTFIIMALLLGLNLGAKYSFKSLGESKRMQELERENLSRQLDYLKYQINPHFFMNTLNNIHALVDLDPEQAKHTIEVLSKLMRYALYEGNNTMAPLQKELEFIRHYVELMRIRYTDKVRISMSLPPQAGDIMVPSLLFTTFVENAFKHGVSYKTSSFIEVSVRVEETEKTVEFLCANSKAPSAAADHCGGVGLENAVKRLGLIYGREYDLKIDDNGEEYRLVLRLPAKTEMI